MELPSRYIRSIEIENMSKTYSLANKLKYDINVKSDKYLLYTQFVSRNCDGCSVAPLTCYANNEIYQELPIMDKYFTESDERMYLDLRANKGYIVT